MREAEVETMNGEAHEISHEDLDRRITQVIDAQLAMSQQIGSIAAELSRMHAMIGEIRAVHREHQDSVPDLVDELVRQHDTEHEAATWRWIKKNATKVMVGVLIALVGAELMMRIVKG